MASTLGGIMGGPYKGTSFFDQLASEQINSERLRGIRPGGIIPCSQDQMDTMQYALAAQQMNHINHIEKKHRALTLREELQIETNKFLRKHKL